MTARAGVCPNARFSRKIRGWATERPTNQTEKFNHRTPSAKITNECSPFPPINGEAPRIMVYHALNH